MSKHFRISSRYPVRLEELGISVSTVLQRAGLSLDLFEKPRALVTTEELFAFWKSVGAVSTDPAIGLYLGLESKTENFDVIALAALCMDNLGQAMSQASRYKQLCCPEEILHDVEGDEWSIQFRWLLADGAEPETLIDLCFAWVLTVARHGTGDRFSPLRLELMRPRSYAKTIERHFGCPVVFGASRNALIFRASDAQRPFVTRNAELFSMLAPQLDEELQENEHEAAFHERVRAVIQRKLTGRRPRIEDIARELHLSPRTLQRRLQDMGQSFQQVMEEARHQLARYYLSNSVLELNETAWLLGYEDANSFVRAFRSWEGIPPARWRETQRERYEHIEPLTCDSIPA